MSNKQLYYVILAGIFIIPFVPLIVAKSLFFPFITGKAFVFRAIVEIIFALWVILAIRDRSYRPKFSWILGAVILFLIFIGLADLFSVNPFKAFWSNYERMEGYVAMLHFGAMFLVMSSVLKSREIWNRLLATSLGVSAIMAVYSFLQIAGKIAINQGGVRVDGTLGNASYLAIYMVFHIFFAALLYFRYSKAWQRSLLVIVALMDLIVLYFTATRGAILGLLGGAFITFLFLLFRSHKGDAIRKVALGGLVALVVLVGVFLAVKDTASVKNNPVLGRFASLSFSEIQTQGRYYVWPMAWKGFLEKPILGWGQEGFNFVFNKYYDPRMYTQEQWFDRAHSTPLDWLVAGGALGLLSYLFILLALFYYIFKSKDESLNKNEKAVMLGLITAYIFNNLFVFDQISSYILFFTVLSFMHFETPATSFRLWDGIAARLNRTLEYGKSKPVAEALVVIIMAFILYYVVYLPWQQNKDLLAVLQLGNEGKVGTLQDYTKPLIPSRMGFSESLEFISQSALQVAANPQAPAELKQQLNTAVDTAFQEQLKRAPEDARYQLFYGVFLSRLGQYEKAIEELKLARNESPKKQQIYFELASNYIFANQPSNALAAAKAAFDLEPSYDEARLVYGLTLLLAGNQAESQAVLKPLPESKIIFDDRYLNVLLQLKDYNKIIEVAKRRVELKPNDLQNMITLTAAYLQAGRRQDAIATLEQIIALNPSFKQQGEYYINEIRAGRNP